jgi:hypothetical protein
MTDLCPSGEVTEWKKSSYSDQHTSCVEVNRHLNSVRDSKGGDSGPALRAPNFGLLAAMVTAGRTTPTA